ncbi:rhomboid family intramembrane serine protease [Microbulbifer guangxiensis]|uniref:rhomboid family intramembrane serine protease n=1 Tax=Microbulbifer guangxiensis TaxID=2904249 RepID=UPI001F0237F8|nr:rhomboid family intramembrane serine protease [Microbulbifer guangxiensis]
MSDWTAVYQFPVDKDLSELAQFIARWRLPLRITEENNRQVLWAPDARFQSLLQPLLERWESGELRLADVRMEPVTETPASEQVPVTSELTPGGDESREPAGHAPAGAEVRADAVSPSALPSWPLQATPLCLLLIALCFVGWFLWRENLVQALVIFPDRREDFELASSTLAWHLSQREYWRLWSPAIVHFSPPHALFNALGIWILGRSLEARAGTVALALLVLVTAVVSNLAQYLWSPGIVFGGMSGVVYGLVGAVLVLQRMAPGWRDVPPGIVTLAVGWLLVCATGLVTLVLGVGVANAAHVGGFISGLLLALLYCLLGGDRKFLPEGGAAERP